MQPEGELDDVGNAGVAHAFALLILEGLRIAAGRQEALFQVVGADNAETGGIDRLSVPLHRSQQLGDANAIDLICAEELRQRLVRTSDFGEDFALYGGAGEPAKLSNELPDPASSPLPEIAIPR